MIAAWLAILLTALTWTLLAIDWTQRRRIARASRKVNW